MGVFSRTTDSIDAYMESLEAGNLPKIKGRLHAAMDVHVSDFIASLKSGGVVLNDRQKRGLMRHYVTSYLLHGPTSEDFDASVLSNMLGYRRKVRELTKTGFLEFVRNDADENGEKSWTLRLTAKGMLLSNEICRLLFSPAIDAEMKRQMMRSAKPWQQDNRTGKPAFKLKA
jgi:hypothetical protein